MAALVLSAAGSALGGSLFGPIGAIAGRIAGALAGNLLDQSLFGTPRHTEGPRLSNLDVMASTEGAPIPRVYGRMRLSGQVIWATNLEEVVTTRSETQRGGKGGASGPTNTTTTYAYFANFAVGVCEGEIGSVLRVWADGKLLDLTDITHRIYRGSEDQMPDALIVAKEGAANVPAYRGLAYIVFERLPLENFGNRIPQLSFEIVRPIGRLEKMVRAVTLIPGTTEFGYEPENVVRILGPGQSVAENRHVPQATSDVVASLDELQALCPRLESVAIVVAWFGSDLRAGHCTLRPGIENDIKQTSGSPWIVANSNRLIGYIVSTVDGRPAYGGTPSDTSVRNLIANLKARGLKVTLYPFVMMDVAADNALPDPWTGAAAQPPYPWRGRITCDPAPGQPGSPDGTSDAAGQINAFFGGDGPEDWGYRRMILHYAQLVSDLGVDAFLLGSELRGLTRVRSASGIYPAVNQLVALAEEVRGILGDGPLITYGADWTEYGAHVVDAAAQEVRFPLDPLWASPHIGAVGIDYYAPLSDWRDDAFHLDRDLASSDADVSYLRANLARGEAYDFYYADDGARAAQARLPITDGLGRPWVFRVKDIWNWWSNAHIERVGGVELATSTAWTPQGKPIWLTEVGCPAVDKGANQPSVFPDPKSSESALPYFSNGSRDDVIQRSHLEALLGGFDPDFGATTAFNPVSAIYGGRMVTPSAIYLWTWDARPYPAFPAALDVWSDGHNWDTGHWLTGRLGATPLDELVSAILADSGIVNVTAGALRDSADGYMIDRPMSPRAAIEPLASYFGFDAAENGPDLVFRPRGGVAVAELDEDDLVLNGGEAPFRLVRAQETELPREVSISYVETGSDYRRAAAQSRRLVVGAARVSHADVAVVTYNSAAQRRADIWLQDLWAGRENGEWTMPPSRLALMPGDVVGFATNGRRRLMELRSLVDTDSRTVKARSIDPEVFNLPLLPPRRRAPVMPAVVGPVQALVLDLPCTGLETPPVLGRLAIGADPWPGPVAVWRSTDGASYERADTAIAPSIIGVTRDPLPRGPTGRFDRAHAFRVELHGGALASCSDMALFGGANAAAVQRPDGAWEILQFANAELVGAGVYKLSRLLRGQSGSEWAMGDPLPAGAPFVLLDGNTVSFAKGTDWLDRPLQLRVVVASRNHGDPSAVAFEASPRATVLRPYAPVHLRGRRTDGGVLFTWGRRTRADGDAWGSGDVPLNEDAEAYALDIYAGASVVRTLTVSTPRALYETAREVADFGGPQAELRISVAQLSSSVGRGFAAARTISYLL